MNAKEIVAKVTNLPVVPAATVRLLQLLENPDENTQAALDVIQTDAVLSAKLLRLCNSAAIGLRKSVASVEQAVFFLGFSEVQRLALALGLGGSLKRKTKGNEAEAIELWRHAVLTAYAASLIAGEVRGIDAHPSVAFTAGLMHDIGKLVLTEVATPELLAAVRTKADAGKSECEAEQDVFGADHAAVGGALLEAWRMPPALIEPVANHHSPILKPEPGLSVLVHLANCVAHQIGSAPGWDVFATFVDQEAAASVSFGAQQLAQVIETLGAQMEKVDQFAQAA